ncbi:hypothetical protein [Ligilactobacillus acidipiscis]|uniref:hypothetical protein n=1 Tax=Ligilactobacillus acidipiscis TaxID=89059 RepID=UPI0023F84729|nr:hypothetical protein [Ligilactobacillus acidipiscis]WEV58207.1 hypothetical protein OZX66_12355 [Ligilactobacillus acidipiscis]
MFEQLVQNFTFNNIPLLTSAVITFAFGFWEYIYSFRLTFREGKSPFPIWMHTFYFAHDSTWAIIFAITAPKYNWNWFMVTASIALVVWTLFEVYNLYHAIFIERQEIWHAYYPQGIGKVNAFANVVMQIAGFYGVVNLLILYFGPGSFLQWTSLTNIVMAVGPGILWQRRGSRDGSSIGLSLVILFGTINTFIPASMFVLAMPQAFSHLWYYLTGIIISLIALRNFLILRSYPPKEQKPAAKKPIW